MRQAMTHELSVREAMSMNLVQSDSFVNGKPAKVTYMNAGQTKITLIGKWFSMDPEEVAEDFRIRVEAGDPICCQINNKLNQIFEQSVIEKGVQIIP